MPCDTAGALREGWTPADIRRISEALAPEIVWHLVCLWEQCDAMGVHGHSEIGILLPGGSVHAVSAAMWAHLAAGESIPMGFPASSEIIARDVNGPGWCTYDHWSRYRAPGHCGIDS